MVIQARVQAKQQVALAVRRLHRLADPPQVAPAAPHHLAVALTVLHLPEVPPRVALAALHRLAVPPQVALAALHRLAVPPQVALAALHRLAVLPQAALAALHLQAIRRRLPHAVLRPLVTHPLIQAQAPALEQAGLIIPRPPTTRRPTQAQAPALERVGPMTPTAQRHIQVRVLPLRQVALIISRLPPLAAHTHILALARA